MSTDTEQIAVTEPSPPGMPWVWLLALASVSTVLNALKPLCIDDPVYCEVAAQMARRPLDPYGFQFSDGSSANHVLAPPVLPYWLAIGMRLCGPHPLAWKLWLLPVAVLLVLAVYRLARRFAPGLALPLTVMVVLSPAVLPAWNLMLDVPALALGLFSLNLFLDACDRGAAGLAAWAGLCAGVAMQTKYTAFVVPATFVVYALLVRKPRLGLLAGALAASVFVLWEAYTAARYGESHFLYGLRARGGDVFGRAKHLALPLLGLLGGLSPALGLLGLVALGARGRRVLLAGAVVALGFIVLAAVPESHAALWRDPSTGRSPLTLNSAVFGFFGAMVCFVTVLSAARLSRRGDWSDLFLASWLALEVAGYFALSPFPATRRLLGVIVAATLLAGRLAALGRPRERLVWAVTIGGVVLAFGFQAVDVCDARAARAAAERAGRWVRDRDAAAVIWYRGDWGFCYYAERAGLRPLAAGRTPQPGDWIVIEQGHGSLDGVGRPLERNGEIQVGGGPPLRTVPCYYDGRTALEHRDGPRCVAAIYRVEPSVVEGHTGGAGDSLAARLTR